MSLRRAMMAAASGGGGYSGKSRLQFGGADGSTTFTDDNGRIWTANGNAQIDTSLGDQRGLFDGSGDYIVTPDSADLRFGTGDFTIKFTMRFNSMAGFQTIASKGYVGNVNGSWLIQTGNGDGRLNFYVLSGSTVLIAGESTGTINAGQDYDIIIARVGTTVTIKRDGVQVASGTSGADLNSTTDLSIGGGSSSGYNNFWFNGWISEWEIP